jgi:uncharacterized protein YijF (DUF1287 family)
MATPRVRAHAAYRWPDLTVLAQQTRLRAGRQLDRIAGAVPFDADDRPVVAMLLLPFFMLAFAIATNQSMRRDAGHLGLADRSAPQQRLDIGRPGTSIAGRRLPAPTPVHATPPGAIPSATATRVGPSPAPEIGSPATLAPVATAPLAIAPTGETHTLRAVPAPDATHPVAAIPESVVSAEMAAIALSPAIPAAETMTLALAPPLILPLHERAPPVAALDEDADPVCRPDPSLAVARVVHAPAWQPGDADGWAAFGNQLAGLAESQVGKLVIYNDAYRRISYPMGDVPAFFGVCTDVIIRAYRALGIDLQAEVQRARLGSGDTSIDHRRTETLRRLFARHGQALPVTSFAEDYRPGDIVTYYRPQNTRSRSHIAIVADRIGPSGRPMIVHNRGWGPQLEDALFADRITGHYRYAGLGSQPRATPIDLVADRSGTPAGFARPLVKAAYRAERHSVATSVSRRKR